MQLKSLQLKNIRSYPSLNINFREGSTLLSGDIGTGKTTILLSIEFALFGLMKGLLSGSTLLRHGEKTGSVTLTFVIEKEEITVSRSLKRTSSGIVQDSGYLEINNTRTECTPVELKAKILSLIGYPDELLTKSKSLIFRYTVYTPQEEMKKIIFEPEEDRLEKLAKIFSIDKYKRIKENAENYAKELRAETRGLVQLELELAEIKEKQKKQQLELEDKSILLQKLQAQLEQENKVLQENESKMKEIEESTKALVSLKHALNVTVIEQKNLKRNAELTKIDFSSLERQKQKLEEELKEENKEKKECREATTITDDINNYKDKKEETEKIIIEAKSKLGIIKKKREESEDVKANIKKIDKCPTCQQDVGENHKQHIVEEENKKLKDIDEKELKLKERLEKAEKNLTIIQKKIEALQLEMYDAKEQEQKEKLKKHKQQQILELATKIEEKKLKLQEIEKDTFQKVTQEQSLMNKIDDLFIDEKVVESLVADLKKSKDVCLSLKVEEGKISQSIKDSEKVLDENASAQENKNKQINALKKKKNTEHWLSNHFLNLLDIIEKQVMASIRAEFKAHFEEWFSMLIEDESITATLDDKFTPTITQNGYDAELENLSGGEKTSVALAYRLALNKVINNMISTIKTKDLIILDEPTDGFSSHQLDKVREVLEALHSRQTIIVSHETKMESFVDHIIKIRKHEHESEVM